METKLHLNIYQMEFGLETRLPLLFSNGVLGKKISINKFVEVTSTNPAKIIWSYIQKKEQLVLVQTLIL